MKQSLETLSDKEIEIFNYLIPQLGEMGFIDCQIDEKNINEKYDDIFTAYLHLFEISLEPEIKLEALKRLVFLNWYSCLEPNCFTGVGSIAFDTLFKIYSHLNDFLKENKIDTELHWMLSYYSSWDFLILVFSENKLNELTAFVKNVNTAVQHMPEKVLPRGAMDNRGRMGIYWKDCCKEN